MKNEEVKDIWNANAEFWDSRMGEGNDFHRILLEPVQLKLLDIKVGDRILDIACGNGQFARKMASLGARVVAVDFAESFIEIARAKGGDVDYHITDATSEAELAKLGAGRYDAAVCTMALMDMENIETLARSLPQLLKPAGKFVFSVLHPCFNSGEAVLVHEREDTGGEIKDKYYVKTKNYLLEQCNLGIGIAGQPRPQYYFHRPVSQILNLFFQNGFVLDGYEEPSFAKIEEPKSLFENVFRYIPAALVCRLAMRLGHGMPCPYRFPYSLSQASAGYHMLGWPTVQLIWPFRR